MTEFPKILLFVLTDFVQDSIVLQSVFTNARERLEQVEGKFYSKAFHSYLMDMWTFAIDIWIILRKGAKTQKNIIDGFCLTHIYIPKNP